jgi:hypothetical protein
MKAMRTIGTVVVLSVTAGLVLACNDRGRTPTDPALDARGGQASFDHDSDGGGRGDDGSGSAFKLFGNAQMVRDPENPSNVVLRLVTVPAPAFTAAGAERRLRVKIWQLDHQLNFHRAFVAPNTCDGGSPRVQLLIDADGDGKFRPPPAGPDFVAHGHVRPPFAACETSMPTPSSGRGPSPSTLMWRFEDLTDEQIRWEITPGINIPGFGVIGPIGSAGAVNWDALEQAVGTAFPNHRVIRGILVEDFNATAGVAYYDLITIFDLTLGTRGQVSANRNEGDKDSDHDN